MLCNVPHLFFGARLIEELRDEIQTNVHGGNASHHHGNQLSGITLQLVIVSCLNGRALEEGGEP